MYNLFNSSSWTGLLGVSITQLTNRLDGLLFVMKTCTGSVCQHPWAALLPDKGVTSLVGALDTKYDDFFEELPRVSYSSCQEYYLLSAEGPVFTPGSQTANRGVRF
jgi:N-acetylglucosamine-6-sulfatase